MEFILTLLQNIYIAWGVAIAVTILAINRAKRNGDRHRNQIKTIREEASAKIQQANAKANEIVHHNQMQCDAAILQEHEAAMEAINREKALSAEKIRLLQEQIDADKTSIMRKTEKEILADITVSLSGFAKRIERVENILTPIEQDMEMIVDKVDNIGVTVSDAQFHL